MAGKKVLFADDSTDEDFSELKINKKYAENYDKWRLQEELQSYKEEPSDAESNSFSESSEDEACALKNPQFLKDIYLTLAALDSKDPNLKKKGYFKDSYYEPEKKNKETPLKLAEYQRNMLLQKKVQFSDEDDSDDDEDKPISYLIKDSDLKSNIERKSVGFEDDDISDDDSEMLEKKKKSNSDNKIYDVADEAINFIKGNIKSMKSKDDENVLQVLRDQYNNPDLPEKERWLNDFFLNKSVGEDPSDDSLDEDGCIIDEETLSGDEETYKRMQEFDKMHRFRYEENYDDLIKHYPRLTVNSLRIKGNRRQSKRAELKERKKREKEEKIREYRKLKALQLSEKLKQLKASAGFDIKLDEKELDDMFDPDKHNHTMDNLFNNEYYEQDGDDEKPLFEDDDELYADYDEFIEKNCDSLGDHDDGGECSKWKENVEDNCELNEPEIEISLRNEMMAASSSSRRRRKRSTKFTHALLKKKPIFDPRLDTFDKYYMRHYGLECEDFIDDLVVRFKYHDVARNNFGLTTEDILQATDGELNQWVSWKKVARYGRTEQDEKTDHVKYKIKAKNMQKMKTILPSLFENPAAAYANEEEKKRNKYEKKKSRKLRNQQRRKRKPVDEGDTSSAKKAKVEENVSGVGSKNSPIHDQESTDKSTQKRKPYNGNPIDSSSTNNNRPKINIIGKSSKKSKSKKENSTGECSHNSKSDKNICESFKKNKHIKIKSTSEIIKTNCTNKELSTAASKSNKTLKEKDAVGCSKNIQKKCNDKSKKAKKQNNEDHRKIEIDFIDESRLAMYNLNPKKSAKKIKHGKNK